MNYLIKIGFGQQKNTRRGAEDDRDWIEKVVKESKRTQTNSAERTSHQPKTHRSYGSKHQYKQLNTNINS